MDSSVKNLPNRLWQLVSGHLNDGAEVMVLKMPTGETFCEYAPTREPHGKFWHSYYFGFPKKGFVSRDACIADAERIAGHSLSIQYFETSKVVGAK